MNYSITFPKKRLLMFIFCIFLYIMFAEAGVCNVLSESDMKNPTLLTNEGWKYLSKGGSQNYDKAEEYFRKALIINSYYADAYAGLGRLIMGRNRRPNGDYQKEECKEALALFDKAISLDKRCYRAQFNKGMALLCLEDYDAVLSIADVLEDQNSICEPHYFKAKAYKGKFLSKKEEHYKKMAVVESIDYMECARNNPDSDGYAFNLFRDIMRTTKDFDSTEKYFKRNIELKPYSRWSYRNYHEVILLRTDAGYLKDTDLSEFERIIKEGKSKTGFNIGAMWELHSRRGEVFFKRKEYDKALVENTECLAGNPNHQHLRERISFLCAQFTDDRCIKSWQRIIQAYLDRGDCSNAAREFKIQYENDPTSFEKLKAAVLKCEEKKPEL